MRIPRLLKNNEKGVTLIELVAAIALTGIISGSIVTGIFQVFTFNARTSNHLIAVNQVQNVGYWVSRDVQQAQQVTTSGASGFPLTLTWSDWDGNEYQVVYTIVGDKLERKHYTNAALDSTTYVSEYIDSANTDCDFGDGKLTLNITATVGAGSRAQTETRVYEIIARPSA
jgi:prepilin-type N-terminal cleavage/methylation domain-containing protein